MKKNKNTKTEEVTTAQDQAQPTCAKQKDMGEEQPAVAGYPHIYMGLNIPPGILAGQMFHGSIYKCDLDGLHHLKAAFDKVPELRKLYVKVDGDFPAFKRDLVTDGTAANNFYAVASEKIAQELAIITKQKKAAQEVRNGTQ